MLTKFLYKILDLAWAYLEPKLKQLVQDELVVISSAIDAEVESIPAKVITSLSDKIGGLGFLKGIL